VAYKGLPRTLIDVDLRYFDYAHSELFGQKVIDGGLGWRSVFAVALGVQYQATDRLTLRAGYLYNTNPIPSPVTLFNVQAPGILTNMLSLGASYRLTENVTASLAWMHGFRNAIEGPILQIPGSSVRLDAQLDTIWAGVNIKFGGSKRPAPASAAPSDYLESPPPVPSSSSLDVSAPAPVPSGFEAPAPGSNVSGGATMPAVSNLQPAPAPGSPVPSP
jgi:long-chain fatty acid transport protein